MNRPDNQIELYSADGSVLTVSGPEEKALLQSAINPFAQSHLLRRHLSLPGDLPTVTRQDVLREAEKLQFVSTAGNIKGFFTLLPRATLLSDCVEAFNGQQLDALNAVRMEFPQIFDNGATDTADLTKSYEHQGRMFRVEEGPQYRLAYAADPGLFAWLRGRTIAADTLPYTIYSPLDAFRRFRSGELAGLDVVRQYRMPDLHTLCAPDQAAENYVQQIAISADQIRFFFGDQFFIYHEIYEGNDAPMDLGSRTARAANAVTVVHRLKQPPRYFGIKTGLVIDAGTSNLRLITLQWDDTNGARFNFRLADGMAPVVIHATLIGGWPKMLPALIGRGLAGCSHRAIPVELAAEQVKCLPVSSRHIAAAERAASDLRRLGIRASAETSTAEPLGRRIVNYRNGWHPFIAVVGDRESDGAPVQLTNVMGERMSMDSFLAEFLDRIRRCSPPRRSERSVLPYQ